VVKILCKTSTLQEHYLQEAFRLIESMRLNVSDQDDWVTHVVHELRAPLANIQTSNRMMSIIPVSHPGYGRYEQIIRQECRASLEIIDDLLVLYRSRLKQEHHEVNLMNYCLELAEPFEARLALSGGEIQLKVELQKLTLDTAKVNKIVGELLNNACKYTANSRVYLSASVEGSILLIEVANQAELPTEVIDHLFEKFYRYRGVDLRSEGGSGLGLFIVKALVELMGGTIGVQHLDHTFQVEVRIPLINEVNTSIYDIKPMQLPVPSQKG
jgi:signal transduction histidine kinase